MLSDDDLKAQNLNQYHAIVLDLRATQFRPEVRHVKQRLRIDDSLDVFAVHGVGGMLGSLLLAVFASPSLGGVGLSMRWSSQLAVQAGAVAAVAVWSGVVTYAIIRGLGLVLNRRVSPEQEVEGIDLAVHGERAYELS